MDDISVYFLFEKNTQINIMNSWMCNSMGMKWIAMCLLLHLQGHSYQEEITELGSINPMNKLLNKNNKFFNHMK